MVHRWTGVPNRETTQRAKSVYLTILAMFCTNFSRTKPIISTILDLVVTLSLTVKTDCNNFLNRVLFKDINCLLLVMVVLAVVTVKMLHWVPASPAALCLLPVVWWSAEKSNASQSISSCFSTGKMTRTISCRPLVAGMSDLWCWRNLFFRYFDDL